MRFEHAAAGLNLSGWIGLPTFSRSQADMQHFFVNGRMVRDKLVTHAVRQAYQDVLFHGRHPAYVLFLELNPVLVDVNAHPTKHEVRFRNGRLVHDFLFRTLHQVLAEPADEAVSDRPVVAGGPAASAPPSWMPGSRITAMTGIPSESRNRISLAKLFVFLRVRLATTASFLSLRFIFATSKRSAMQRDAAWMSMDEGRTGIRIISVPRN